jgi:transglutaminase-like putative cysteine protease
MRLIVRHQTTYHYDAPIAYALQSLRLSPRPYAGLNVLRWSVYAGQRRELASLVDGYGNLVHCHAVNRPHTDATIFVDGEVETTDTHGVVTGALELLPAEFYLRSTPLTAPDAAIAELAAEHAEAPTPLDRLHRLMLTVAARMAYTPGATDSMTTAAAALASGAGVCQDHAHVFIAAARLMQIPARYVSGYLWAGSDDKQDLAAAHAWAEAYVPDLGWVGFDPSNGICPTETYVRVAIGLDYWSAAPVRGIRRGVAAETLTVKVNVQQLAAGQ